MIELVYLNPNIKKADADKLVSDGVARREKLYETFLKNAESIQSPTAQAQYISSCAPFLGMF